MIEVKMGGITRTISKGALELYIRCGWKVVKNDKTNTKKSTDK